MAITVHPLTNGHRLRRNDTYHQFSTAEQFTGEYWVNGAKIYEKTVYLGTLPNNAVSGVKNVAHGISNLNNVLNIKGWASDGTTTVPLPTFDPYTLGLGITMSINKTNIVVATNSNQSSKTGYATLTYTKTS